MKILRASLSAFALSATTAAWASPQDFPSCDGYPAPNKKSDGMTTVSLLFGLASQNGDIRRSEKVGIGPSGADSCDKALADPLLLPDYSLRRAHLLQAKAVHQIASSAPDAALATLSQSDALIGDDRHRRETIGIGNHAVRGFALINLERKDEARQEIAAIEKARPYASSVRALADFLRLRIDSGLDAHLAMLKADARFSPGKLFSIFQYSVWANRLSDAAAIGGGLSFDLPRSRGGWTIDGEAMRQYELIAARAEIAGNYAYALIAAGQGDAAAKVLADADQDLVEAMAPPPAPPEGVKLSKSKIIDFERRKQYGENGRAALDLWKNLIQFRKDAASWTPERFFTEARMLPKGKVPVFADMIMQLKATDPGSEAERQTVVNGILAEMDRLRLSELKLDLGTFRDSLPRPETPAMQPRFKRAGDGYFLSDNGFSRRRMEEPDCWTIRFTHNLASAATVEELVLLSAASFARQEGYDSILILARRTVVRTTRTTSWGGQVVGEQPMGHEGQLNIRLLKSDALPPELESERWRIVPVGAVIDELTPRLSAI